MEQERLTTRDEHLAWCKRRAHEYIERGDLRDAVTSMWNDLNKHPDTMTAFHPDLSALMLAAAVAAIEGERERVERFVDQFK